MKINWGHKILAIYLVFIAGIAFMVVMSTRQKIDLVTPDYYAEEIKFQEKIDEINNASKLSSPVNYSIVEGVLILEFPKEFKGKKLTGQVMIYCPSDVNKDINRNLDVSGNTMKIMLPELNKGAHIIKIKWSSEGIQYYFEKNLFIA
jgi:hypothetical protein